MKHLTLTLFLLSTVIHLHAQQADSLKFNNRKFKQEIGIDIKNIFGGFQSASLVWKIRNDHSKLITVSYAKNWRFQLNTSSSVSNEHLQSFQSNNIYYSYTDNGYSNFFIQPSVGFERVYFFNRFNFYSGADFGVSFRYFDGQNGIRGYFNNNGNIEYVDFSVRGTSYGPSATGFVGMKYRISDRFSISVESALSLYFSLAKSEILDNTQKQVVSTDNYHTFGHNFIPLRFITFNYHFKEF